MKIYISGPITGVDGYLKRFDLAENALVAAGYEVVNPAKVNRYLPESTTHDQYMEMSFVMLEMCDTVFFLEGWENSKGARMEFEYALERGYTMTFEGGKGQCRRRVSKREQESSRRKHEKKYISETKASAFFAR